MAQMTILEDWHRDWPGERIKELRQTFFRSTRLMQERTGIRAGTWQAYENGRRLPDNGVLLLLEFMENEPEATRRVLALVRQKLGA
jgi:DNA-binding transcriptional regulator YiaG